MQLQRLTNPQICRVSWQSGDQGELTVQFQSKFKGLKTRRANFQFQLKGWQA